MYTSTEPTITRIDEHIVEIVSDSGEGAQRAGQTFGAISAKMGNGVWTVEIIPAEIKPPSRSPQGASGIRIRLGASYITNMGDHANLVVAFNEQVLRGRIDSGAYEPGTRILLESKWSADPSEEITQQYKTTVADFRERGFIIHELAMEETCRELTEDPRLGKNMFVLGMLCQLYQRNLEIALTAIAAAFAKKSEQVRLLNENLLRAGYEFANQQLDFCYEVPPWPHEAPMIVTNGNQAIGLGVMASGIEMVSMYPITPATSASHFLADVFHEAGGVVHQAEDEIAAISFALGTSFAGKTACTITSGPGLALKMESIGLAVMAEIPLVIISVQRGGPATGLPTKVEQGDLLSALFGAPGDAPKVVMAAATIEECFHFVIVARSLAETFRIPVILLTDANLATGVQSYPRPVPQNDWLSPPIDTSAWDPEVTPYDWNQETGLSSRPIPGQRGGEYVLTGLAHTPQSKVAYDPISNQRGCEMRSRKLAALQGSLKPPQVHGDTEGALLLVGWGSTQGAIKEAVDRAREEKDSVSSLHLRFLSPLEPGLTEIFRKFRKVMTIEINYSDAPDAPLITPARRRIGQLAWLLRAHTLTDIDCWTQVHGQPLQPGSIYQEIKRIMGDSSLDTR
uniref:2-oxoglutarate ferredoxin oxidoreductase subunit alpha n=1 Tax=Candidatus Kentrum sp. TC TaxID=2126339 RepID=A0A450YKU3_9GAMM|nr:MAG: 2-oxoglutarate ferredoxin oxidoreductase subunit alpha [Candidatus Kentron sp. TC]VFK42736.1 MAG: 2-oxoglutarate ferredoxin oxidoreductase subunit alpha [Candidatus Kentron sp. TC]VFK58717.1 MAG: 2-oxoglutarate ferredoxin oxidoreductase subunit alpha [Candidatus Kentron sp. TC]